MSMEDLTKDIMWDVLSRLDFKTVGCCQCVCKSWRDLVLDPYFINNLLWSNKKNPSLLIHDVTINFLGRLKCIQIQDKVLEVKKDQIVDFVTMHDVDLSCPGLCQSRGPGWKVITGPSVNGLIHVRDTYGHTWILNPIAKQYLTLPDPPSCSLDLHIGRMGYGFGSLDDATYKVMNICRRYSNRACNEVIIQIEVFTLGTNNWREIQPKIDFKYWHSYMGGGLLFNGCVHWISNACQLFVFDLDNETFSLFASPPFEEKRHSYRGILGVLKGCLSQGCYYYPKILIVWVMKEHGVKDSWYKAFTIKETGNPYHTSLRPFCLFDGLKGATLIAGAGDKLVAYCLQTKTRKTINLSSFTDNPFFDYIHDHTVGIKSVITYHPTFLNLQKFASPNTPVL